MCFLFYYFDFLNMQFQIFICIFFSTAFWLGHSLSAIFFTCRKTLRNGTHILFSPEFKISLFQLFFCAAQVRAFAKAELLQRNKPPVYLGFGCRKKEQEKDPSRGHRGGSFEGYLDED